MKNRAPLALWLALAAVGQSAAAADLRCGSRLVLDGDSAADVRARCGEPTEIHRSQVQRPPIIWRNGHPYRAAGGDRDVVVETWIYNLGPNMLMRQLKLEDGIVVSIDTLGYGHR